MAAIAPNLFILLCQCFIFSVDYARTKDAQKDAEDANNAKSRFLASMSHEIRTPMNAILGITQIQLQNENLSEQQQTAMEKIYSSGNSLLGIINDILDLSKIETGKMEINPLEYDMPSFINDTVQLNFVQIGSKPIKLILDLDETIPSRLIGDELRIKQILNNILSNAVKYTDSGHVKLNISHQKHGDDVILCFVVEDTGQGMKQEDCEKLFSEYTRFNLGANREKQGTGLGLSIAKNLIELMEGTIKAESEYGKGSIFTVTIKQKAVECEPIGSMISDRLKNFSFIGLKQSEKFKIVRQPMPYGSVLVVDDVETNIYVAQGFLSPYKLNIDLAISGFETIDLIKSGKTYDVIFMDHMMPKMDGVEATRELRSLGYKGIILALTANALAGNKEMFMKNGFDGFISKPIDMRELNSVLNEFIRDKYPEEAKKFNAEVVAVNTALAINPKMLEIFRHDAEKAVVTIKETLADGNIKLFTTTVHAMKSALANIGEEQKSQTAAALEEAGINKDLDFINANINGFVQTLEKLIVELTPSETEAFDDTITEDILFLKEQLEIIKAACEDYDDTAAYTALDLLKEKPWKKETIAALEKIRDTLFLHSDFDEAAKQVENILSGV
jgi:CheY-like chemotaxis protein/nitrogen-specific signal transduction histidine kinase/HPt (histidine-containing phosphotransfer) domain-containing protein